MRKLVLGLLGASALTMGTAANATLTVSTWNNVSAITGPNTPDGGMHYTFSYTSTCGVGTPPVMCGATPSMFSATVSFINTMTGYYGLGVQSTATLVAGLIDAATDVDFSHVYLTGPGGFSIDFDNTSTGSALERDAHETYALNDLFLNANQTYTIHIEGSRGNASSFDGNLNFAAASPPVPEPTTWALMLLGFGAVGWQLRRRSSRRPLLTQAA
jgi:hypothetical protein